MFGNAQVGILHFGWALVEERSSDLLFVGVYTEYLEKGWNFDQLAAERKIQLARIGALRDRDVLVYAADLDKGQTPNSLDYSDLVPVQDQLSNLSGTKLDVVIETPGGSGEVVEDIVRLLHEKYQEVGFIVPGWAKSAGTIMVMAGDDILMEPSSALGPIDAQLIHQGKQFSADALLEGIEKIKDEVDNTGALNKAYIPILQGISPGELQSAENALKFAKTLVTEWLAKYKFKSWTDHSSTGLPVTDEERHTRAEEVAEKLCNHRGWLTHGRSLKIADLEKMRLTIFDYSKNAELWDAIRRYHTLLRMAFATNIYKVIETPVSQILRFVTPQQIALPIGPPSQQVVAPTVGHVDIDCPNCQHKHRVQANLDAMQPLVPDAVAWPQDNKLHCENCATEISLVDARLQIEGMTGKKVVTS